MTEKRKTGRPTKNPGEKATAERIFDAAVDLFSQRGYDNVSIRDIAAAVGIKESSIYKHYTSKEQILQKIVQYPLERMYTLGAREETTEELIAKMGFKGFIYEAGDIFSSWMAEPKTVKILRIFFIELYHNDQIRKSYTNLVSAGETFWTSVFEMMMKKGQIKPSDPNVIALEFLAFFWYTFTDYFLVQYGRASSSFMDLYMDSFERHIAYFVNAIGESK